MMTLLCIFTYVLSITHSAICPRVHSVTAGHSLAIQFDHIEITSRNGIPLIAKAQAATMPNLEWYDGSNDGYYTVLTVDPDAPGANAQWLHWLVVNIQDNGSQINNGYTIMSYAGPTPPKSTGDHNYCFYVFKQTNGYDVSLESLKFERRGFDTNNFLNQHRHLQLVAANKFISNYQDQLS